MNNIVEIWGKTMKKCKFCGKELSDEMDFCLYCMKKQNEEITIKKSDVKKKNSKKMILLPAICVILVLGIVLGLFAFDFIDFKKPSAENETPQNTTTLTASSQIENSVVSWNSLNPYDENSTLTDDQKTIVKFFKDDYIHINDCNILNDYNVALKGHNISFEGQLEKFISQDDVSYSCLISNHPEMKDSMIELKGYFIVKGKFKNDFSLKREQRYNFYGRMSGVESYDFEGQTLEIPCISVDYYDNYSEYQGGGVTVLSDGDFESFGKAMFGENTTVQAPVFGEDFEWDDYHDTEYVFKYIIPENQTVELFKKIEMTYTKGYLVANTPGEFSRIYFSTDFKKLFVVRINREEIKLYVECYDTDFNQLWSNAFHFPFDDIQVDYNSERIYFEVQGYLYYINIADGSVTKDPAPTGYIGNIMADDDGVVAYCSTDDSFVKVDFDGNILWTANAENVFSSCRNISYGENGYIFATCYYSQENSYYEDYIVIVDKNGKIITEIENSYY